MNTKFLLLALSLLISNGLVAQIAPLSPAYKVFNAPYLVEGKIISQESYKTKTSIFTNYTLDKAVSKH